MCSSHCVLQFCNLVPFLRIPFLFAGGFNFVLLSLHSIFLFVGIGETPFYFFITCEIGIWFVLLDEMLQIMKLGLSYLQF